MSAVAMTRIVWTAGPISGSVRIPSFEVGAYIQALRDRYGRTLSVRLEDA